MSLTGMGLKTVTALSRWSCIERSLPSVSDITKINIFDFDNTLFLTPLPRRAIWAPETIGLLQRQEAFHNGSWWHDPKVLRSVGGGVEKMEPLAWQGWWAEDIVDVSRRSIQDPKALNVLVTGRSQAGFSDLIAQVVKAKGLDFHMIVLKPEIMPDGDPAPSTAAYKNAFFRDTLLTYVNADIFIWEDRKKQADAFNTYLYDLSELWRSQGDKAPRKDFEHDIHLVDAGSQSDWSPEEEVAQVTRMINDHNNAIAYGKAPSSLKPFKLTSSRLFTGYILTFADSDRLKKLIDLPDGLDVEDVRILADNIMVSYNPPSQSRIKQAGGMGSQHQWKIVARGSYNDSVWAVRAVPLKPTQGQASSSYIILCHKPRIKASEAARNITQWIDLPADQQIIVNTRFEDKVVYRVEVDGASAAPNGYNSAKRRRTSDATAPQTYQPGTYGADFPALGGGAPAQHRSGRGGSGGGRGVSAYQQNRQHHGGRGARGGHGNHGHGYSGQGGQGGYNSAGAGRGGGHGGRGGGRGHKGHGGHGARGGAYRSLDDAGRDGGGASASGQMQY